MTIDTHFKYWTIYYTYWLKFRHFQSAAVQTTSKFLIITCHVRTQHAAYATQARDGILELLLNTSNETVFRVFSRDILVILCTANYRHTPIVKIFIQLLLQVEYIFNIYIFIWQKKNTQRIKLYLIVCVILWCPDRAICKSVTACEWQRASALFIVSNIALAHK